MKNFTHMVLSLLLVLFSPVLADESEDDKKVANMAEELVKLRAEVESLYTKIDLRKLEVEVSLRGLMESKRSGESQKKQLETVIKDQLKKIQKEEAEIKFKKDQRVKYLDVTYKQIDKTKTFIDATIDFKKKERLREVDELKRKLENKLIDPDKVLSRLWSLHEDEIRLTTDNGLYNMEINIDGKDRLVKVARLGMVLLYFKTIDGNSVGYAVSNKGQWEYKVATSEKENKQIKYLFDCLEKNLQSGFFELPNPKK